MFGKESLKHFLEVGITFLMYFFGFIVNCNSRSHIYMYIYICIYIYIIQEWNWYVPSIIGMWDYV